MIPFPETQVLGNVSPIDKRLARTLVIKHHYLHRGPCISFAFGMYKGDSVVGVCTFGVPPSRHLQIGARPSNPDGVIELNRLWVADSEPRNSESWFIAKCLSLLPPLLVVSYADTKYEHRGYVYRASNWHFGGLTDEERKTPRYDYICPGKHTRDAFRTGQGVKSLKVRRLPKFRYWIATGNRRQRRAIERECGWRDGSWKEADMRVNELMNAQQADKRTA